MKQNENSNRFPPYTDQQRQPIAQKSIAIYRVTLVKDETVSFGQANLCNSHQAHAVLQNLILTRGQPDREQFVVALLSAKNQMIGMNIVSVGALSATTVHPREVLNRQFCPIRHRRNSLIPSQAPSLCPLPTSSGF
ncbi:JAB domain-containing protein [Desulfosarcina variabilis]|uniref:JAB domain-containing protein n=1 Tax=Desulfosarcina variabilis TaxID=2300 RepID=UPI003AFB1C5F